MGFQCYLCTDSDISSGVPGSISDSDSDSVSENHFPAVSKQAPIHNPSEDPREPEDERIQRHLVTVHRNLGHLSNKLAQQAFRDAEAPQFVIQAAGSLRCSICGRLKQIRPARPAAAIHAREFNQTLCIDFARHNLHDGVVCLAMHMVDEASRFHIAEVFRTCENLDTHVPGNCNEDEPMAHYMQACVRYFGHPRMLHVDADGVLNSEWFKKLVSPHNVFIHPCAGDAHWKTGVDERDTQAHTRLTERFSLDDGSCPTKVIFDNS